MKKTIIVLLLSIITIPIFANGRLDTYKNATLQICDIRLLGCVDRIIMDGKSYLIDIATDGVNTKYKKLVGDLRKHKKLETSLQYIKGLSLIHI